ncbi:hypothetical protein O181_021787 [Austropuccinia psidii MF-1]|uniref:DUF4939 domain-containing protein n=1 Tax=Austropuccinia psidii MF-1 TaxID=1389203 RepID=A0A9Q3CG72_9BASI|nr:hypothetical protein [Austropuccinia psidii MF-1]
MQVKHSLPAKNTRSQRHQAVLTPTARAPLDHTTSVHQLSENLDRGPPMEGAEPFRRAGVKSRRSRSFSVLLDGYPRIPQGPISSTGEAEGEEEEESEESEVADALEGAPEVSEAPNLSHSNQPLFSLAEPNFLKIMEQMTQLMGQLAQAVAPRDTLKAPEFKNPSMKAPDSFYGTKAHKLRGFIQSCQLIFHIDPANFFSYRKKVLYATFFLMSRAGKWIEPYLSNISNEDPTYLLNNWKLFETHFEWDFFIIDSPKGEDLILGYDFLYHFNPIIDWNNGLITYYSSHKDSSGITSSTSNDFATSLNSVALVGELKTPSLPPSVNIPSIKR